MARQSNKTVTVPDQGKASKTLSDAAESLKESVEKATKSVRSGVEKGRIAVKEHPKAALGVALGASFAAGAIAGAAFRNSAKKSRAKPA